uniref:Methyltransferase domain-containing protein n=3 Tax=Passerellidae TaxID=1729112 RepID=A0A8D2MLE2_ZONAL
MGAHEGFSAAEDALCCQQEEQWARFGCLHPQSPPTALSRPHAGHVSLVGRWRVLQSQGSCGLQHAAFTIQGALELREKPQTATGAWEGPQIKLCPSSVNCIWGQSVLTRPSLLWRDRRWHIELQPWASPTPSLNYEASRFLKYISTSQISCEHMNLNSLKGYSETTKKPWSVCLDERFSLIHRIRSKKCRLYSLGLGNDDNQFELSMANSGCEVHRFDPSIKSAHIQQGRHLWHHRLSIDWRDPNPAIAAHKLHSNTKKLGTVLNEFGHQKIDVLKADVESAEWKILENLILEDVVEQIGQLVFEVHMHWPGFEVSGNDSTVVRYWYSLLRELELKDFRLFHTYKDLSKPQMFLKKEAFNASSCYTLSWVNTRWK